MKRITPILSSAWTLILFFAIAKLAVHFLTYDNYGLHRDAYLYYAQSQHLDWGFVAVPPSIAVIGKLAVFLFGNTVFALRFFPAVIGAVNIVLIALAVKELGGQKKALALACLAYLFSPSYLHTNTLFQPVAFNHFYWILFSYLMIVMIRRENPKYWIWIAPVMAFGFLNKYSIVFIAVAFVLALLLSPWRKLFFSKYFLWAMLIGFIIIMPNIYWQYSHNWPVLMHMEELRDTQLVHVRYSDFLLSQLMMNVQAIYIWLMALLGLLFFRKERKYRLFAFAFILVILLIMLGNGKGYYTLGVYPMMFVFGAIFFEKYVKKYFVLLFLFLMANMIISLWLSFSFDGIPFMKAEKIAKKDAFRWEDGKNYDIPQDMADMRGWDKLAQAVIDIYQNHPEKIEGNCAIFCEHYGQAGAVMFYGKGQGVPQPISTNGSFIFWAPDSLSADYLLYVHSGMDNGFDKAKELDPLFDRVDLVATINDPWFREDGTEIYLCRMPNEQGRAKYSDMIRANKARYKKR